MPTPTFPTTTYFSAVSRKTILPRLFIVAFLFVLFLSACGSSSANKQNSPLIVGEVGDQYIDNFNPYAEASGGPPSEMIYESLLFTNLANSSSNPWLATSWQFSSDEKQLTFHLRNNVTWNDNTPFTADDVVFTINSMKQYPAMDKSAVWKYLSAITAPDPQTVVATFKVPFTPLLWYLGRYPLLPKHLWASVGDPDKYIDTKAVGTGPFMLKQFSPQVVILQKNPHYWQAGKPAISEIRYPTFKSNDTLMLNLISDKVDYASIFAPNLDKTYVQKDPTNHHYWLSPNGTVMFYPNNAKKPFNDVAVRKAISLALDRTQMSRQAEQGYEQPANPTALILPNAKDYLAPAYAHLTFQRDVQQAKQLLENAGYTLKNGFYYDKQGNELAFKIDVPTSYSDEVLLCTIASNNLKEAGIDASINTLSDTDWYNNKQTGNYDLTIDNDGGGLTPYYYYNRTLNSTRSAPIGTASASNFARWQDPTTDTLLNQYATTGDTTQQKQAIMGLEKIYVEQVPTIPLLDAPVWFEYNSSHFTGWPSAKNLYTTAASPEQIVLNLQPA